MTLLDRRRWILAGAATAAGLPGLARARAGQARDLREAALDQATASPAAPPAMAAALVTRDGMQWAGVRGVRRVGQEDAATLDDRWHLGSNTKAMTAAVWARLVERGRVRWGLPLAEAFPEITVHAAFAGLTVEDLMRHRAGLSDRTDLPLPVVSLADTRPVGVQRAALARALTSPPSGAVGDFAYANVNYVLAGAVIERVTGRSWEEVVAGEVFEPLGIATAGFGAPAANTAGGANAWGHRVQGETRTPVDPAGPGADNPAMLGPAGTAHMTLADYGRFVQAMMGGGPQDWLSIGSLSRLTAPPAGDRYALGWIVGPDGAVAHEGSNTLWHAIVIARPTAGRASIVLSNGGLAGRTATAALALRLLNDE
jgi:CubicO group peptidase (beta-lactamase class C family)